MPQKQATPLRQYVTIHDPYNIVNKKVRAPARLGCLAGYRIKPSPRRHVVVFGW
jgi:hypothetical protein